MNSIIKSDAKTVRLAVLFALLFSSYAAAACIKLTTDGETYELGMNTETCFEIYGDDFVFDGAYHEINHRTNSNSYGIMVLGKNVLIKNVHIWFSGTGVVLNYAKNAVLNNVDVDYCNYGVFAFGSDLKMKRSDIRKNEITGVFASGNSARSLLIRDNCTFRLNKGVGVNAGNFGTATISGGLSYENIGTGIQLAGVPSLSVIGVGSDYNGGHGFQITSSQGVVIGCDTKGNAGNPIYPNPPPNVILYQNDFR